MNFWMHCNKCSVKHNSNIKLFLTECGHLFCENCIQMIRESKCVVCGKSTNSIEISSNMEKGVRDFFVPVEMHLKQLTEICNFQMQHYNRIFQTVCQKYAYAKKQCIAADNRCKNLTRENKMLKNMLMSMGPNPPFQTSTPALTSDHSQTDNMSVMSSVGFTPGVRPMLYGRKVTPNSNNNFFSSRHNQLHFNGTGASTTPFASQMRSTANIGRFNSNVAPIRGPPGTASSMEQLRRVTKRT